MLRMDFRSERRSTVLALLAAVALHYALWNWSVATAQVEATWGAIFAATRLLWAIVVITLIGFTITRAALRLCVSTSGKPSGASVSLPILLFSTAVGQLVCVTWVFIRSGFNGLTHLAFGVQPPITGVEICILLALCGRLLWREYRLSPSGSLRAAVSPLALFLWLAVAIALPISLREFPREITLSSDPDQHAFWASQVLRLGAVPWDQGILGIGSFGYPAGFAVINALWAGISGLSVVEIVTIQPLLQFLLAVCITSACAPQCIRAARRAGSHNQTHKQDWPVFLTVMASFVFYWTALPYGLQTLGYFGEGGARMSAALFSAIPLCAVLAFPRHTLSQPGRLTRLSLMGMSTALLTTINPITAAFSLVLTALCFTLEIAFGARLMCSSAFWRSPLLGVLVVMVASGLIILCDPYYAEKIFGVIEALCRSSATTETGGGVFPFSFVLPAQSLWQFLTPKEFVGMLFGGTLPAHLLTLQIYLALGAIVVFWLISAPRTLLVFLSIVVSLSLACYASLTIPPSGDVQRPLYLVQPYLVHGLMQSGAVMGFLALGVGVHAVLLTFGHLGVLSLFIATLVGVSFPVTSLAMRNEKFNLTPRVAICGTMGCLSAADRDGLRFIKELSASIVEKYPHLSYEEAPKILILGYPSEMGVEQWIFPTGASRILPIVSHLPVAFFYGRGSSAWTYDNYRQKVCLQFDLDWLKRRNVRYLFMVAQSPGCIRGRDRVLTQSTVLFEKDGTKVIQLF